MCFWYLSILSGSIYTYNHLIHDDRLNIYLTYRYDIHTLIISYKVNDTKLHYKLHIKSILIGDDVIIISQN